MRQGDLTQGPVMKTMLRFAVPMIPVSYTHLVAIVRHAGLALFFITGGETKPAVFAAATHGSITAVTTNFQLSGV